MAVVVQAEFQAEFLGSLSTKQDNSVNIVIKAFSGSNLPDLNVRKFDTYILSRSYDESHLTAIIEKILPKERHNSIQINETGGILKLLNGSDSVGLSDQRILRLAKIGINIEKMFGCSQEIQWAECQVNFSYFIMIF